MAKTEEIHFMEMWRTTWETPYIMRLALSAGIGGLLFVLLDAALPESPRWLYRNERKGESRDILERIYPAEIAALKDSVMAETADEDIIGHTFSAKLRGALSNPVVRHGLAAGITVQVAQQFVGINTVVSMMFVDRYGRRKLMIISMFGIISCLLILAAVFSETSTHAPKIDKRDSRRFAPYATCPAFAPYTASNAPPSNWNCMKCLRFHCGFCSNRAQEYAPGACVVLSADMKALCHSKGRTYFRDGCPSKCGYLAIVFLVPDTDTRGRVIGNIPSLCRVICNRVVLHLASCA